MAFISLSNVPIFGILAPFSYRHIADIETPDASDADGSEANESDAG
jgi:hypothetical protein